MPRTYVVELLFRPGNLSLHGLDNMRLRVRVKAANVAEACEAAGRLHPGADEARCWSE